jgi:hypothetical protein
MAIPVTFWTPGAPVWVGPGELGTPEVATEPPDAATGAAATATDAAEGPVAACADGLTGTPWCAVSMLL